MKSTLARCVAILAPAPFFASIFATPLPRPLDTRPWQSETIEWLTSTITPSGGPVDWANFSVPLDWNNPDGEQIRLIMSRLPAHSETSKYLFFNPGGPQEAAKSTIDMYENNHRLRQEYHLVGLDTRGVGMSTPLQCNNTLWNEPSITYPKTEAELEELIKRNKALGESCQELSGDLMYYLDTASVARDFEAARQAVGADQLNFLGFSYGTQIGVQYAELFPHKVGRFVLDGILDHSGSREHQTNVSLEAIEKGFARWAEWCQRDPECEFGGSDVVARYETLLKEADTISIPAPGCDGIQCRKNVTGEDIRFYAVGKLMWTDTWKLLGHALHQAQSGDGTYFSRRRAKHVNNNGFVDRAVICLDWEHTPSSLSDVVELERLNALKAPHVEMGAGFAYNMQLGCIGWPAATKNPPHRPKMDGVPPMLLVNAMYDADTGYAMATSVHDQIPGSVLLTRDGDGHTSYL